MERKREVGGVLALAQLVNSLGDGGYYVTSALFFTRVVGLSITEVGLGLTLGWGAGLLLGTPLGSFADRRGLRGTAIGLALTTAAALASFLVVRSFPAFLAAVVVYGVSQSALSSVRQALLARLVEPGERVRVRARLQAVLNAGLGVGAALGGVALSIDTPPAYLAVFALDAATFGAAAVLLARLPRVPVVVAAPGEPRLAVLRDGPYTTVAALNAVMLLYMPMVSVVLPLWVAERTAAPTWMVAALFVLNTAGVVAFQVRVARGVTDLVSAARAVRRAGVVLLGACGVFGLSTTVSAPAAAIALLLAGAALQVLGEMLLASGAWEASFALAPADKPGQYQGLFGLGVPVARMVGPLALTSLVLSGPGWGWIGLGVLFLAAGVGFGPAVRWAARDGRARSGVAEGGGQGT